MPFFDFEACEPLRIWNRLEPRARQVDFDRALQARVHDPLWMLARQWQMGEFQGEDTGTAVLATLARRLAPVTSTAPGDGELPLEALVEPLPLDLPPLVRARLGRRFLAELGGSYRAPFAAAFPITGPADPGEDRLARAQATVEGRPRRVAAALAGRAVDGVALRAALSTPAALADLPATLTAALDPADQSRVVAALEAYRAWFDDLYPPPAGAWVPNQLEYQGSWTVARDGGTVALEVAEHVTGRLDWHAFDQGTTTTGGTSSATTDVRTVIPSGADFAGMPNPRWWQLEDAAVDLGGIRADATDLAKIVVAEFALVYGNNWLVIGLGQPVGTLAELQGILVTDTFGHRTLVSAATSASAGQWTAWDLFSLSPRVAGAAAALPEHLLVPACAGPTLDGAPHEAVALVRDESADMVWAIEQRVPDGLGASQDGTQAARRLTDELAAQLDPPAPPAEGAPVLRYRLGTDVPESWIPFVPVRKPAGGTRSIRLQRGAMPRTLHLGEHVRPRTSILAPGLEATPPLPYYVDEEEVPRAGVRVSGALRRARWTDGRTVVWHGRTVTTGRGEADSGLRFDAIETIDPRP